MRCLPSRPVSPLLLLVLATLWAGGSELRAHDWANWRGPEQTGVSRERDLPERFSTDRAEPDSNLLWKAPYGGRSTPLVMHGRVYLNNQAGEGLHEQERVLCLDAGTGKKLWEKRFNVFHTDIVSERLGWTNLCGDPATDYVYWHGTQGHFVCFDRNGKIVWRRQLTEQDGRISGYGGRLTSPLVDKGLVVVGMLNASWGDQGVGGNRFLALDARTGEVVWWSNPAAKPRDTYSSGPVVAIVGGQRLLVSGGGDGSVHAINAYTGKPVWSYPFSSGGINATPVVAGHRVYVAHGNENLDNNVQGRVACLDMSQVKDGQPTLVWQADGIKVRYTTPIYHEGRLYVADDNARLHCLDAKSGEALWRRPFAYGRNAMGSPVWADGKIYVGDINSKFHVLEPGTERCKRLYEHFFPAPEGGADVEVAGTPAVANGRIYFQTNYETYCIGKKEHTAKADPVPEPAKEAPPGEPAAVRIAPADVTVHPGAKAVFWVHVLDKFGRELSKSQARGEWSLPVPPIPPKAKSKVPPPALKGSIDANVGKGAEGKLPDGTQVSLGSWAGATLHVADNVPSQQGYVQFTSKLGKAQARVRVAPRLPYAQDFSKLPDGVAPAGWVNAQNKVFVVTLKDGTKVLRRNNATPSPLVARGNAYIGLPSLTNYTIEADVMGNKKGPDMPDIGVVANRYTLALWGNLQRVRLTSWDAIPRVDVPADFPWKPGVWYRLKLTAEVTADKAIIRGKAWPRDEKEPQEWTVQFTDPVPNRSGAPALYGYVTGFTGDQPGNDVYYSHVRVYPNKKE